MLIITETLARISETLVNNNSNMAPVRGNCAYPYLLAFFVGILCLHNEENRQYNLFKLLKILEHISIAKQKENFTVTVKLKVTDLS